jgi:transposase-like protein
MIVETTTCCCTRCQSSNMVRNGWNASENPKDPYNDCEARRTLLRFATPKSNKEYILRTYLECGRMWGIQRRFGVSRPTWIAWIKG